MSQSEESQHSLNDFFDDTESGVSSSTSSIGNYMNALNLNQEDLFELNSDSGFSLSSSDSTRFSSIDGSRSASISRDDDPLRCVTHSLKFHYLCVSCDVPACSECLITIHGNCQFKPLDNFVRKRNLPGVNSEGVKFSEMESNVLTVKKTFMMRMSDIQNNINLLTDQIIVDTQKKRDKLLLFKIESWRNQIAACKFALNKLERLSSEATNFGDMNACWKKIAFIIYNILEYIEGYCVNFYIRALLSFQLGEMTASASPKHSLIELPNRSYINQYNTCKVLIKNGLGEEVTDVNYVVQVVMVDSNKSSVYLLIYNPRNGVFILRYFPTTEGTYILNVYLNRYVVESCPLNVKIIKKNLNSNPPLVINESEFSKPWGVCCDGDGRIVVVDRGHNCVKIFRENGTYLKSFGKEGNQPGQFIRPAGVAVDKIRKRIIIVDKDNHRVQVFTWDGTYIFHFGEEGTQNGRFKYPWDVAVNGNGEIAVTDTKNRRVQFFTKAGVFIRKFYFSARFKREIELPRGLAFRADGYLMITDFSQHKIVLLSPSFDKVQSFGCEGLAVAEFFRPQGIAVDSKGRFAVCDCKNHRIQVFESDGKFCGLIKSSEDKSLVIDSPQGIDILPDGRIVVTQLGGNIVQILKFNDWRVNSFNDDFIA